MESTQNKIEQLDISPLKNLLSRIKDTYNPLQIWLFGSRARGDASPDSDWDLCVIVPDDTPDDLLDASVAWHIRRGAGISSDVIPFRLSEFEEDRQVANTIPNEIAYDGVLLYER